ncbi:response regulator transcription factor [Amedibacillus sp. YH-ame6]
MYKIMIVEDDEPIAKELSVFLTHQGYTCCIWDLQEDITTFILKEEPHVILLDINLPKQDGFVLCTQIRTFSDIPIIFVTSRNSDMDELCSMRMGGDDFITKPYNSSVLLAHIEAIIKRSYKGNEKQLVHRDVTLNLALSRLEANGKFEELTKNEIKIMYYLFQHKGEIVSREDLIDYLWDNKLFIDDNALSVNVTRIRNKFRELGYDEFIITKHRQGYVI